MKILISRSLALFALTTLPILMTGIQAHAVSDDGDAFQRLPLDSALKSTVKLCNKARSEFYESILCPSAESYWLKNISDHSVEEFLTKQLEISPKPAISRHAVDTLIQSMNEHLQFLLDEGTAESQAMAKLYAQSMNEFSQYLEFTEKTGHQIFIDPNAEWAPGLAAIAVILIDQKKQTVTILMHGNADS